MQSERHLGLLGATGLGVGAIVGGGILALAGVAFATTGPSAIIAFGLNGAIAFITAVSFAKLARRFPESGGLYAYAKKLLSIEAAFLVGWVVWFASILAGVLYALGFSAFALQGLRRFLAPWGDAVGWLFGSGATVALALLATGIYTLSLIRRLGGQGDAATFGKVLVFVVLLVAGGWVWVGTSPGEAVSRLSPFYVAGPLGLLQAMGYTFIALQGFDLIAAVTGEVRDPGRTVPRAMYLSLGLALAIYLPLLFLIATVGAPADGGIAAAAARNPEGLVAEAAERFLGSFGYWLVIGAGILSMLSALRANLLAASRISSAMARDRTLPSRLGQLRAGSGTPAVAVAVTGAMIAVIAIAIGNVAAAGAASSLIFLVSFALAHGASIVAARRSERGGFGALPWVGGVLCIGLAVFQAVAVPAAGSVVLLWLLLGAALYLTLFAPDARLADARAEAHDPDLARLRGRSPLVLVPIANPANAASLVDLAATLRTPGVGRVLLLSIVRGGNRESVEGPRSLRDAEVILGESLHYSLESALSPETLFTIAGDVWPEIARVARLHRCETVVLGLPDLAGAGIESRLEALMADLEADVVVLRAPRRWRMADVHRVLIPLGGQSAHSQPRARLIASLSRSRERSLTFLGTVSPTTSEPSRQRFERDLRRLARDEAIGPHEVIVEAAPTPLEGIMRHAEQADLVVMGMRRLARDRRALGELPLALARGTDVPIVMIGRRPSRSAGLVPWRLTARAGTGSRRR